MQLRALKLRHLRYFVTIVERGSLSRAAAQLHVAQPALSQQMAELEGLLGAALLHRSARGVRATTAGEALYAAAVDILRRVEQLPGIVRSAGGEPEGTVTLGMSSTLAAALAGPFMDASRKRLPKVALRFSSHDSVSLRDRVAGGRLDLGVVYETEPVGRFLRLPLFRQRLFWIQRRKTPRSPASASLRTVIEHPLVLPSHPNLVRVMLDKAFAEEHLSPDVSAEMDVFSSILSAVHSGLGNTILPKGDFSDVPGHARLFATPIEPPLYVTVSLISHGDGAPTRATEGVRECFVAFARDYLDSGALPDAEWIADSGP
ncbi:MAG: LysR family transcriptional regulator [Proteobacteria bacterium]|nr:LysR family transcriptional regulator [Pseudomonadota bacterium]